MVRTDKNNDDGFRSVAIILAVLGTLAVLSFVMAGVVGAREKSDASPARAHVAVIQGE
jgi:hypothetical protein